MVSPPSYPVILTKPIARMQMADKIDRENGIC
jgi:hypothetical protein